MNKQDDFESERQTNLSAVIASQKSANLPIKELV
jgi:hypothetical protein